MVYGSLGLQHRLCGGGFQCLVWWIAVMGFFGLVVNCNGGVGCDSIFFFFFFWYGLLVVVIDRIIDSQW